MDSTSTTRPSSAAALLSGSSSSGSSSTGDDDDDDDDDDYYLEPQAMPKTPTTKRFDHPASHATNAIPRLNSPRSQFNSGR